MASARQQRSARIPTAWLFTDERLGGAADGDGLWQALARLPRGAGVIVRHYSWPEPARRALLAKILSVGRRRGLLVVGSALGRAAGGVHWPRVGSGRRAHPVARGLVTAAAHDARQLRQAFAAGADLVFLSPVFDTASHPGARTLGRLRFGLAALGSRGPVMALGGLDPVRARDLRGLGAAGFGAIDAWTSPTRWPRSLLAPQPGISSARCW